MSASAQAMRDVTFSQATRSPIHEIHRCADACEPARIRGDHRRADARDCRPAPTGCVRQRGR